MIIQCEKCEMCFDDCYRTTICPHETFPANDGKNNFAHHPESYIGLMPTVMELSDNSVIPGLEAFEAVYAKDQPEYRPLRVLKSMKDDGAVMSRWTFTDKQRKAIANGDDLWLEVLTFHGPLQPVLLIIGRPFQEWVIERYGLAKLEDK